MEISDEQFAQIKLHLRVDGDDEDLLIKAYADAATGYVEKYCDGALVSSLTPPVEGECPPREILFKPAIWSAMLLLIGHWYSNREAVNVGNITSKIPLGVDDILFLFRRWN